MAKDDPHFRLRLPAALKAEIEAAARVNNRSINAEIVSRLEAVKMSGQLADVATNFAEEALKREKENLEVLYWFREQQNIMNELLDAIAESDGNLDKDFMSGLRALLAARGKDTGFPKVSR